MSKEPKLPKMPRLTKHDFHDEFSYEMYLDRIYDTLGLVVACLEGDDGRLILSDYITAVLENRRTK